MHRAAPSHLSARHVVPKSACIAMVEDDPISQMRLGAFLRGGARTLGIELDLVIFDSVEQMIATVSYTHLTLPTNREV